ncbi:nucleotide-binding universal stress UspA family protein [Methanococcus maripaludis]|uniref:Nucleotide-binding universal stress UspA family protein n=1 Tax=Methanococcus maripaludis TaxID=39152 RepID=A0A2L1C900_METMI|nr:universal stress protein [Methanococcus maripaludis]AVB75817.1 Putative universal stress protein [Methanococcus maripaludis]MBA2841105.1 nucleotide-binding universal stress UspA family protein [Methanococcus maripaludis]MBA2853660.1 nucleotide-binding universal stress UspA family protein [Methanococcus maripaludis]MBA2860699.1 nucleotide-binding universal stress UspA family protein [Methanococcus maripaludis]MBA2864233.1 nucleotide-binding universal stress UspA family protein [Methanococcus
MAYKKIIMPTDGSKISIEAAEQAIDLAKATDGRVYGIYVIDIVPFVGLPTEGLWESMKEVLEKEGHTALRTLTDIAREKGVEIKTEILEGTPSKEIVEYAEAKNADLIVMGTTGKTGLDKLLLGSVAERVLKKSHCPVLLVKSSE